MTNTISITKQVSELIEPILDGMGFELVDLEYLSDRGRWVLRIYIDKSNGVTLDDCATVSGELGDIIDIKNIIDHEYVLEVSSPGLNRPLKKEADFIRVIGKRIRVKMRKPVEGRRNFTGILNDFREKKLVMESEGGLVTLAWPEIEKANLVYEFND